MSDEKPGTQYLTNLNAFRDAMRREFPDPIAVSHRCARCQHTFTSKPDGFVDEQLENEIAAHHERCFVVGEWVRWTSPVSSRLWADAEIVKVHVNAESPSLGPVETCVIRIIHASVALANEGVATGSKQQICVAYLRRIQRPGQPASARSRGTTAWRISDRQLRHGAALRAT